MSVGLLLITHNQIGEQLLEAALATFGHCPLSSRTLHVAADTHPESLIARARHYCQEVDQGDGVLVLTDCFGSTPSNIAGRLLEDRDVRVVSGVSLPMLIRVLNYSEMALATLAEKAVSGGCEGIVLSSRKQATEGG
jgi:PTS system ascorbate-specific IIA component